MPSPSNNPRRLVEATIVMRNLVREEMRRKATRKYGAFHDHVHQRDKPTAALVCPCRANDLSGVTSFSRPAFTAAAFGHFPDATFVPAPADGVLPEGFFSTTNLPTYVRVAGAWRMPREPRM